MEKFRIQLKSGFSLLELLIVMGVTAILMGLGVYGLLSFQYYTEVQSVYSDISSLLSTTRNKAQNGSISNAKLQSTNSIIDSVPDFYGVLFSSTIFPDGEYGQVYCDRSTSDAVVCAVEDQELSFSVRGSISVETTNCIGVLYETLTADIYRIFNVNSIDSQGECTVDIDHNNSGASRVITISATNNVLEIN